MSLPVARPDVLVFDMDGVLVDVTDSYRAAIQRTVEYFTGRRISNALIQEYKNRGGWNNDWALSRQIALDLGVEVDYETVVAKFQEFFLGSGGNGKGGLIQRERWLPKPGLLESLQRQYRLSIFTGRIRKELAITLERFVPHLVFHPIVCAEDVSRGKPDPEGLFKLSEAWPGRHLWYLGDTVDDARCSRMAGIPFVGIAAPSNPRRDELIRQFHHEGAIAVLDSINDLPRILPA